MVRYMTIQTYNVCLEVDFDKRLTADCLVYMREDPRCQDIIFNFLCSRWAQHLDPPGGERGNGPMVVAPCVSGCGHYLPLLFFVPFSFTAVHHCWHLAFERPPLRWGRHAMFMCMYATPPHSIFSFQLKQGDTLHPPPLHHHLHITGSEGDRCLVCLFLARWTRHKSSPSVKCSEDKLKKNNEKY